MLQNIPHNSNSRNNPSLIDVRMRHGMAGYGVYFCLLELLAETDGLSLPKNYDKIAYELRTDAETVRSVVEDFSLFLVTEKKFSSEELSKELQAVNEARKRRAEAGRKGGIAKAKARSNANENRSNANENRSNANENRSNANENRSNANENRSNATKEEKQKDKEKHPPTPPIKEKEKEKEENSPNGGLPQAAVQPILHTRCRIFFENFIDKHYHEKYYWLAKDASHLKRLLNAIKFARANRTPTPLPVDDDDLYKAFEAYVQGAFEKGGEWLLRNFSISMLSSKYNEIRQTISKKQYGNKNSGWVAPIHTAKDYDEGFKPTSRRAGG